MELEFAELPDDRLLENIATGCEASWTALYRRHQARIYRFSLHMCGSAALAEEATQETFLAFLDRASRYRPERGSLSGFLLGMARNKMLQLLEREPPQAGNAPVLVAREDPAAELAGLERRALVRKAVLGLPPVYREVVVLCDLEEMDYEDAAQALDCPVGTVRSRLHRARQMLAERLEPVLKQAGASPRRIARER